MLNWHEPNVTSYVCIRLLLALPCTAAYIRLLKDVPQGTFPWHSTSLLPGKLAW